MVRGRRTRGPKMGDEPVCTSPKRKDVKVLSSKLDKKMPVRRNKTTRLKSSDSASSDPLLTSPKSQITSYFHAVQPSMEPAKNGHCEMDPFDEVIEHSGLSYASCISILQSQGVNMGAVSLKSIDTMNGQSDSDTDSRISDFTTNGETNGYHADAESNIPNGDPLTIDLTDSDCESKSGMEVPTSPNLNLRLSPRKHASTLSRCAATFGENASTPHRIKLCDPLQTKSVARKLTTVSFQPSPPKPSKPLADQNGHGPEIDVKPIVPKLEERRDSVSSHKLTEYFPVRRSIRKTKKAVLEEKMRDFEIAVRKQREDGLKVASFNGKGRGVVADQDFKRGEFVVEYAGELIPTVEARDREALYARTHAGCYMYYFKHNDVQYCIDATAETGRLGRLVNHSRNGNLVPRSIMVDGRPCLVLVAATDICSGTELCYDYGDRSKESLKHHPWLAL